MNELLNSPIIRDGVVKVEVDRNSIVALSVAVTLTAVIVMLLGRLLKRNQ